jgi:hypothetical protein
VISGEESVTQTFKRSFAASAARADRESIDELGTLLVTQVATLQLLGRLLTIDYLALYEAEKVEGWLKLVLFTEGLYQQIHAVVTTAAVLVGQSASPALSVRGLAQLEDDIDGQQHSLGAEIRRKRREIDLLRWLLQVRNKAVQHRADAGYVGSRAVVLSDGFALLHSGTPVDRKVQRKANDLFIGLHRRYGNSEQERVDSREVITYLDLMSHSLFDGAQSDSVSARQIVTEARSYDVIVSPFMLDNTDVALAALIEMVPLHPNRLVAGGQRSGSPNAK